ncbi:thiopurine S-methyltransferase [Pseudomaricurvus alkylphenolicus]|uniref:thiopurine S-methyltransferase n=1 Tax=Pseudomaricurvus alkylphenolicus TaxID=1306991 RepID=UPI0014237933|nr:thiopurine S-methyltransferase [Pseudomaricurvus alkylphenolicus]NIB42774.1 thiopurine S-methyltransferase [Pseudomaricurvus alkylphenolicus]
MEAEFWHEIWESNELGFHESQANPMLVKYIDQLGLEPGSRLFLPLCGKTLDIAWLLSKGFRVAGAELSELAVQQLFEELGVSPEITEAGGIVHYQGPNIDIFQGDIFALSAEQLGPVDAVYDRAALVALPEEMRSRYTRHLMEITSCRPQLLLVFDYDQNAMAGPPFSISEAMVRGYYDQNFEITPLDSEPVKGKLKGQCEALEQVWLLRA